MPALDVAAGLVFHRGKLLITQRMSGTHLAGTWEFPGGKREPGESFQTCLAREIREELGVEVGVGDLFERVDHRYTEKEVHIEFYRCALLRGEPQAMGCAAIKWIGPEGLQEHEFPPADARLLERLAADPGLWED